MSANRRPPTACLLAMVFVGSSVGSAMGQVIVTPNALAGVEGNSFLTRPPTAYRYMQLISSSEFSALAGPVLITEFHFRPDAADSGAGSILTSGQQIFLSTTSQTVSTLSPTFANNIGADNTLVLTSGGFSTNNLPGPGNTHQFDIAFPLTTPFLYNPAAGNLLLDIQSQQLSLSGQDFHLDAFFFDPLANAAGRSIFGPGAPNVAGGNIQPGAAVIQFGYTPVPEPSGLILLATAGLGLAGYLRRRRMPLASQCEVQT